MRVDAGPISSACRQIRDAWEAFEVDRSRRLRLLSLLTVTDGMLTRLEVLNLLEIPTVSEGWPSEFHALVQRLPFTFRRRPCVQTSPTEALDLVFDVQARLLRLKQSGGVKDADFAEQHLEATA